jgi:hypothetical protein
MTGLGVDLCGDGWGQRRTPGGSFKTLVRASRSGGSFPEMAEDVWLDRLVRLSNPVPACGLVSPEAWLFARFLFERVTGFPY